MRGNILGILFSILSGVLIFLIVVAYGRSDRIAPEFRFASSSVIYDSKTTDEDLVTGISAFDSKDGDLTGRIVVEKVVLNREKETAVVYYAVADYSGNVTKQSRVFPADIADLERGGELPEDVEGELFPNMMSEDGSLTEGEPSEDGQDSEENTQERVAAPSQGQESGQATGN